MDDNVAVGTIGDDGRFGFHVVSNSKPECTAQGFGILMRDLGVLWPVL